ncbi:MAG: bifunctional phosphoribosyl-AMP cyclohydrolase/phosphoribosyl-ATP diphosphatase HisIE [Tuberibacillus sp.]
MKLDFSKGLVPAIVVDDKSGDVLMLAYVNEESYQKMLETGETWFYSRSRQELWNKGATSGNKQIVTSIQLDCDRDTLLVRVEPQGPACHTGARTCFYNEPVYIKQDYEESGEASLAAIFDEMLAEIEDRKINPVENSYTNYLFEKGTDKICKKVMEEAGEVVIAAKNKDTQEIVNEFSNLLFHSLVLLSNENVSLDLIKEELAKRHLKKGNFKGERKPIKKW